MVDLKVKNGVVFRNAHFLPHMTAIVHAALQTAPTTNDDCVWITEGWRDIRDSLDFHELCAAFDFRCKNIVADSQEMREELADEWAEDMRIVLGDDYDVIAHGVGDSLHIHAEFDPR